MDADSFINLVHRCLAGEADPEEHRKLNKLIEADPARKELYHQIKTIWHSAGEEELAVDEQRALQELRRKTGHLDRKTASRSKEVRRLPSTSGSGPRKTQLLAWAAILIFSVSLSVGLWVAGPESENEIIAETSSEYHTLQTERGEMQSYTLPDGTSLTLGPESKVTLRDDYGNEERRIQLHGEAYFEVSSAATSFEVETESAVVTVLGTKFSVQDWQTGEAEVILAEGRLQTASIRQADDAQILESGTRWKLDRANRQIISRVNADKYLSWKDGGVYFEETPLSDVITELERRFNIELTVEDSTYLNYEVTAHYTHESVDEILKLTSITVGGELIQKNNDHYLIK